MAARYFLNIGTDYNSILNWSDTSGGAGGFSIPTSSDDVFFDANSGNCTVNVVSVGKTIDFTGYINTITMSNSLTISGDVTLDSGMTITGAAGLIVIATATLTSNGKDWPNSITFINTITITLADDWHIYGDATLAGTTGANTTTINGADMYCYSNCGNSNGIISGTTKIILAGTGIVNVFAGGFNNRAIDINTAGTITFISGFNIRNCIFTYITGTVIHSGNMAIGSGCQIDLNVSLWDTVSFNGAGTTITLLSDLNCNTLSTAGFNNLVLNGFSCFVNSFSHTGNAISGTTHLIFSGTGSWSGTGQLRLNTTINTAGTLTISGSVAYYTGTLTYTAGTVITTGSTLNILLHATLNTNGMVWNNYTCAATCTVTLLSNMNISGNLINGVSGVVPTINGFNFYVGGDSQFVNSLGTTNFILNGTGTYYSFGNFANNLEINTAGTITFYNITAIGKTGGTLKYTSGTVITSGSSYNINGAVTLNVNSSSSPSATTTSSTGINFNNLSYIAGIHTHIGNITSIGDFKVFSSSPTLNGGNIYLHKNIDLATTMNLGTTVFNYIGTGVWTHSNPAATFRNSFIINTTGTLTISGTINYFTGPLTYTSGTVVTTGSTLNVNGNTTLNTNGVVWNVISIPTGTITINSLLTADSITTINNTTFAGTNGFTTNTLSCVTGGVTTTLKSGITYSVNSSLLLGPSTGTSNFQSNTTSHAYFNLNPSATQNVKNVVATWIDSSGGKTIKDIGGVLSNTINWSIKSSGGNFFLFFY